MIWRSHGGPTELWNLLLLCRFHHTLVHQRTFTLEMVEGEPVVTRADGVPVPPSPTMAAEGPGIVEQHQLAGVAIDSDTIVGYWDGQPLTRFGLDSAVSAFTRQLAECPAGHSPACRHAGQPAEGVAA